MLTPRRLFQLAALGLFAIFCFGLLRLFALRFSTGDIFPPYSSLRSDPLGTKVLYQSLAAIPDLTVLRNERSLDHLPPGGDTTLFAFGVRDLLLSEKEQIALQRFIETGGRVVMTFLPMVQVSAPTPKPKETATPSPSGTEPEPTPGTVTFFALLRHWDVKVAFRREQDEIAAENQTALALDSEIEWHSTAFFTVENPSWQIIYACETRPVLIERAFGRGSIVLATDSYFASNEALLQERHTGLLAWLAGTRRRVLFDETHLSIFENPGVSSLLRKYRLTGFICGVLLLAALWLWKNTTHFLRSGGVDSANEIVTGRDSFGGFVNLLRRGIAPGQLLELCVEEWKKTAGARGMGATNAARSAAISAAIATTTHPVLLYNQLNDLVAPQKWKKNQAS